MKKIVLILALISNPILAKTEFRTVKLSDGKVPHCKSSYDLYRSKAGVFKAHATKVSMTEEEISFDIDLKFLACVKADEEFKFVYKKPYARFEWPTLSRESMVVAKAKEVHLKAFKDGIYKVLSSELLENKERMTKTITVSLKDVLDNPLEGTGTGSFDFWVAKKMNYTILNEGVEFNDLKNFGSYRINFEVKETEEGLKINLL